MGDENPLLREWTGPYGGLPPFDLVEVAHFEPAFEAAMAENLAEVERIAANPESPGFDNTLAALERVVVKGRAGEPVLISWDDAGTLFHEFGHALHGLASDVSYPSLSGTAVARDYVEFPIPAPRALAGQSGGAPALRRPLPHR